MLAESLEKTWQLGDLLGARKTLVVDKDVSAIDCEFDDRPCVRGRL